MEDPISYVWVTNKNPPTIPSSEITHGIRNVISTAEQCPNREVVLYVDYCASAGDKHAKITSSGQSLKYHLFGNRRLPTNMKIVQVPELLIGCKDLIKSRENNVEDSSLYTDAFDMLYKYYLYEMQYGKPAYAGNFIKLMALYRGGFVSDIGVIYEDNKDLFNSLEKQGKGGNKFVTTDKDSSVIYSDATTSQNESILEALTMLLEFYSHERQADVLCALAGLHREKLHKALLEQGIRDHDIVKEIRVNYAKFAKPVAFIKSATLLLKTYGSLFNHKKITTMMQERAWNLALGCSEPLHKTLTPASRNHKASHLHRALGMSDLKDMNNMLEHEVIERTLTRPSYKPSIVRSASAEDIAKYSFDTRADTIESRNYFRHLVDFGRRDLPSTIKRSL